jgi:NAD(P)-dependent dehydrogenase (short-subunit alcohol dehydrogenase family)
MHVVVTGASSGIGIALAREFGRLEGDRVTLVARRQAAMEEVARGVSAKCHIVAHDLSDASVRCTSPPPGRSLELRPRGGKDEKTRS